jgi:SNF2 family DNA or RNA helicase
MILGDEVGLGKTYETLAAARRVAEIEKLRLQRTRKAVLST